MTIQPSMLDDTDDGPQERSELGPLIEKGMVQPWWKLRFDEPLETVYQRHIARQKWRQTNIGGGLCLLIFNSGTILDYIILPDNLWISLFLRICVGTLPCALLFWCTRYVRSHRVRDGMVATGLLIIAAVIHVLLTLRGATPGRQAFSMGLLVVVMNIVIQLPLMFALACNFGVFLLNAVFLLTATVPLGGDRHLAFLFVTIASVITLLANSRLDTALRQLYLVLLRERLSNVQVRRENRALNAFSYTDTLTGIANRRRLDEAMHNAWQTAHETETPLALLIVDIDHFKRYNDRFGHPAGDGCLKRVAQAVASATRTGMDLAARMGGEEFAVLLVDCDSAGAVIIAERIHRTLAMDLSGPEVILALEPVTVSIGVAARIPANGSSIEAFIQAADDALYQAKKNGRNQTYGDTVAA
jgi:diguanylate cyclase (GGDEF)-like protein